jgi:hypothetical protein
MPRTPPIRNAPSIGFGRVGDATHHETPKVLVGGQRTRYYPPAGRTGNDRQAINQDVR